MEPAPNNFPSVETPAADTLFEGQAWVLYGMGLCYVVVQNQNEPSFKNGWIPQRLSYIDSYISRYNNGCVWSKEHSFVLIKNMCPSTVLSAHFPNVLRTQKLDGIRVSHQSEVIRRSLSYEAVFLFRNHSRVDLPLCQEVCSCLGGGYI